MSEPVDGSSQKSRDSNHLRTFHIVAQPLTDVMPKKQGQNCKAGCFFVIYPASLVRAKLPAGPTTNGLALSQPLPERYFQMCRWLVGCPCGEQPERMLLSAEEVDHVAAAEDVSRQTKAVTSSDLRAKQASVIDTGHPSLFSASQT